MFNSELLSKEWCNLIFQGRNKDYGAYAIRKRAGKRYARALLIVIVVTLIFVAFSLGTKLFMLYTFREAMKEVTVLSRLKPLEAEKGHELKAVSAGRKALPQMKPGASMDMPEIAEGIVDEKPMGIDGPAMTDAEKESLVADADSLHNANKADLPVEGPQLTPTEVVEQMPEFPGGLGAFMKWMDQHVVYPPSCIKAKIEGDVEVSFIVDATGQVSEPEVTKKCHPDLDRAALAAIGKMPKWKPGRSGGQITAVRITVPVHFQTK